MTMTPFISIFGSLPAIPHFSDHAIAHLPSQTGRDPVEVKTVIGELVEKLLFDKPLRLPGAKLPWSDQPGLIAIAKPLRCATAAFKHPVFEAMTIRKRPLFQVRPVAENRRRPIFVAPAISKFQPGLTISDLRRPFIAERMPDIQIEIPEKHILNAIPDVVAASPGVKTMLFEEIARKRCDDFKVKPAFLGMYGFRHKTLHKTFAIGFPLLAIVQIAAVVFLVIKFA